jgi:hypothetical protein
MMSQVRAGLSACSGLTCSYFLGRSETSRFTKACLLHESLRQIVAAPPLAVALWPFYAAIAVPAALAVATAFGKFTALALAGHRDP